MDAAGGRTPLTAGTIVDETPQFVPCVILTQAHDGAPTLYGEVLSTYTLSATRNLTLDPDPFAEQLDVEDEGMQGDLRRRALGAAILRAMTCDNQYLFYMTLDDDRFRSFGISRIFHPFHGPGSLSQRSSLTVWEGFGVLGGNPPNMTLTGRTDIVSQALAQHCLAATRSILRNRPGLPQRSTGEWDRRAFVCTDCGQRLWFGTCCHRQFCYACVPSPTHLMSCPENEPAVRMMPALTLENGQQPPEVFDLLLHPRWCMYRYVEGDKFVLACYFDTADAHYYDRDDGIKFAAHLFRRDDAAATQWVWMLELTYTTMHRDPEVDIIWKIHLADEFDSMIVHHSPVISHCRCLFCTAV